MRRVTALIDVLTFQVHVTDQVSVAELSNPTPCDAWTVRDVLAHSVAVTRKFADFAAEITDAPRTPTNDLLGDDHVAAVRSEANRAITAWSTANPNRMCHLPFGTFNATEAAGINLVDVMAHTWDIATAIDLKLSADSELWRVAHEAAVALIGESRDLEHYGPALDPANDATPMDQFASFVGRSPREEDADSATT